MDKNEDERSSSSNSSNYLKASSSINKHPLQRPSHQRTRSVDLKLTYSSSPHNHHSSNSSSSSTLINSSSTSSSINDKQSQLLITIEEKVAKLYYKHGLFCSRHPSWLILLSLIIVTIISYQIITFHGIFGSSYDVYISSSSSITQESSFLKSESNSPESSSDSTHPLMKHFDIWPDSYVRNELDNDQNIPPWFQQNLSYAYVQQIYIRSAIIPWNDDMQLVDAIRAPFELIFDLIESISNFQYKNDLNNDFGDWITMNDVCFQIFEPTLSKRYQHISKHLPSYSCLLLSPANIWNGDRIRFQQDSNLLTTLLKFQDIQSSPVPSGIMHDLLFGVAFDETGIRRTYGRNRQRTITYSITLILRKNIPQFIDSLRTFLYKRYPISMMNKNLKINNNNNKAESSSSSSTTSSMVINNLVHNNESDDDQDCSIDNKTKHIYFHNTFTYNYLLPLILIYTAVCLYMNFSVRKIEIIRNKWLYSLLTLMTILMSLFMSFGICFRLRFHSVLIVNRLLPYFVAGISFENMLVLTKAVLANPHLDSKVRVAQALSREGLSITKNLLTELTLLSIGSFTFMPFFQECCKIAAVCFLSDFFIQITFFTPFLSSLIQRINEQSIISNSKYSSGSAYLDKHFLASSYPRNIYARPGEPVQQKTPKRLRFIYFLAQLRLVQRCFILLLSACIGLAIYNAYLVLEQDNTFEQSINHQQFIENRSENLNNKEEIPKPVENISPSKGSNSTKTISKPKQQVKNDLPEIFDVSNRLKSFMKLLGTANINKKDDQISSSPSSSSSSSSSQPLSPEMSSITNPYYRILYDVDDNPMPKPFANHHWTNLFSLYNISLVGRFISILPPILLSIPISPEKAKQLRNDGDTDYYTLKRFIPMKFTNGEYVISDDDDFDKFDQPKRLYWSKDDLNLIIGLWLPCLLIFIYLIYQLYRCICTRNYAEWRSQLSSTNPLARLASFIKRTALNDNTDGSNGVGGGKQEKLIRIDITLLNYDREKESYLDEKQFLLNNQDIELICTNMNSSLVATSSLSGDIRCYDALTCESLATIKRSQNLGDFSIYKKTTKIPKGNNEENKSNNNELNDSEINQNSIVVKTEGNILRTLFYRINNDDEDDTDDNDNDDTISEERKPANTESSETNEEQQPKLMFRPIWCMDIYDRYVLVGCGSDDGRFEVWDAYTSQLVFVYHPESPVIGPEMNEKHQKYSYGITAIKSTYWGVALARINGQMEMLELELLKEDKYLMMKLFQQNSSSSFRTNSQNNNNNTELTYRCKYRIQAHKQPITRIEIIDSLEDEEFIRVFGSRGCLITGSMDTTLKVFALDNFKLMYTLNGHCGSIVSTCIDPYSTASALSGCQLGQLCVWDLNTGTCIFSMQAHSDAEVLCITTSPLYYVTSGTDNNICIWDRYSGHLIHTIHNQHTICKNMIFLEPYILMTVRDSELIIWDVNDARSLCLVPLANHYNNQIIIDNQSQQQQQLNKWTKSYQTMMIKNLLFSYQRKALICDYGNSICIINNPFETKKLD